MRKFKRFVKREVEWFLAFLLALIVLVVPPALIIYLAVCAAAFKSIWLGIAAFIAFYLTVRLHMELDKNGIV